ncbi:uncharacterized protein C8A04DRAFT_40546 [Dichotomopilus funicola]|uniref:DUF4604 domain-containing protein n=1 Tax=Dichotomopilus funicola TaxID=1934379 RepID=A0AAN6UVG7_9PEZI|nr:hypothetical protein C8A04DRAFT_40546 [Dichotomopilus funicola]
MSQKISAKNLQYNATQPRFLALLRGQGGAETNRDGPDPILAARRRPVKPRSGSAEAEDAPLVVDEHGHAVADVTVGADGAVKEKEKGLGSGAGEEEQGEQQQQQQVPDKNSTSDNNDDANGIGKGEKLVGIGEPRKKRRIGRVIEAAEEEEEVETTKTGKDKTGVDKATAEGKPTKEGSTTAPKVKTKKAKKIKLSFGDDDG